MSEPLLTAHGLTKTYVMGKRSLEVLRGRILTRTMQWLDRVLGGQTIERLIEARLTGRSEAAEPLRDLGAVRSFLGGAGIFPLFDAPWVPVYLVAVYLLNFWLGLVATVGAIVLFALAIANEIALRAPLGRARCCCVGAAWCGPAA